MARMFCKRFALDVYVTRHARERMVQRGITERDLSELLETGEMRYKDETRLWIAKDKEGRDDNLVCAAVTLGESLIVRR